MARCARWAVPPMRSCLPSLARGLLAASVILVVARTAGAGIGVGGRLALPNADFAAGLAGWSVGGTVPPARTKLELLGLAPATIDKVLATKKPFRSIGIGSPIAGVVTKAPTVKVRAGTSRWGSRLATRGPSCAVGAQGTARREGQPRGVGGDRKTRVAAAYHPPARDDALARWLVSDVPRALVLGQLPPPRPHSR